MDLFFLTILIEEQRIFEEYKKNEEDSLKTLTEEQANAVKEERINGELKLALYKEEVDAEIQRMKDKAILINLFIVN